MSSPNVSLADVPSIIDSSESGTFVDVQVSRLPQTSTGIKVRAVKENDSQLQG